MPDDTDPLGVLSTHDVRDLLGKGWLTHDGMWFVHAAADLGIDKANELNRAAIRGMSQIEVKRLVEILGVDPTGLATSREVCRLLTKALGVLLPDSISSRITLSAPNPSVIRLEWDNGECFAYKGMRRAGLLDGYQCGVIYRIACWLETLGIHHEVVPAVGRCQMATDGVCTSEITLDFDS